ncbi:chromatin remodeling factor mit1 [Trichoderma asperellum]|uniref:Chromatin remodeling factor mit1 n=1 Tax=Trichoderma asperellum TaxID=101201 RepID=A0A6V8QZG9_TRIAP|nr:chromatin remodeling factor mit1 [Trichoderma asperellum]
MNETSVLQNLFETRDENTQNDVLAPDLPINDMSDLGDLALLKAALDEEQEMAVDEVEAGESPLNKSYESTPDIIARTGSDTYTPDSEILHVAPATQIEVALPEVSAERRAEYSAVYSRVVERIAAFRDLGDDVIEYDAEFTDGRIDSFDISGLLDQVNGEATLRRFQGYPEMTVTSTKRKYVADEEWDSELDDAAFDAKAVEEEIDDELSDNEPTLRLGRMLRSREASSRPSYAGGSINSEGEDEDGLSEANQPSRRLRKRKSTQLKLTSMSLNSSILDQDQDELALESRQTSEESDSFMPIVSDLAIKKGRPNRSAQRSRRIKRQNEKKRRLLRKVSDDSDIEFEQPRRSARANRNQTSMQDDAFMDDDSFYVIDDKAAATPKIISVCHTCGGSKQRGQLLYCQGCSLTYHKNCIGYRSNRDHMATKIGEDDFVLQCRFCLNTHLKKDRTYGDVNEDEREYLVKWQEASFAHCSWVPGAWLFGVAAGSMRSSFAKRAAEQNLLKLSNEEAIPDEFITPDIIFNVKLNNAGSRSKTKEEDLANISKVKSILVKFHGLGYDDVVWDSPPSQDKPRLYSAFVEAYRGYIEGKHFRNEPSSKIRERIRAYKNNPFKEVDTQPVGLKRGKLMGYQIEGLNWLLQNFHQSRSIVLADEMGLDTPRCWPFLIVVPNATCPNWRREFKQWAPGIRVVAYHGGKEPQDIAYTYELFPNGTTEMKAQVVIMSYDSAQDPRTLSLFKSANWAGLVVDEGQRLKNDQNLLYTALRSMKIPFRLLLTGTPLQNNKRELFNLLQFIDEKQNAEKLDQEYAVLDKDSLPKLHEKIRPYFLRRTKLGVLKFLPPMAQIILPVTMTVIQEKLSKSIMAKNPQLIRAVFANSKMSAKDRGSLNNILMQLRKCLCHPFMYSEAIEERHHDPKVLHRNLVEASAKLLLLEIMLPKLKERGHRVLIFSQFLQQLDIIEDFLNGLGYGYRRLDGSISSLEKQRRIDAFNEPGSELFAFLLSTRAGGVGINLATADTVIIMDPDFNPHQDIQALSRAHRIGQKNKVLCFQLVTKDSVEERIMEIGRKKMALDHALIESMDDEELEGADLESILKHGAQALFDDGYEKTAIQYDSASVDKLLDRSQMEKTAANDDNSAESQFNFARVWANDKLGFEERVDTGEEQAPEPISSSVWDRILAEREEEAKREAEANKEVLGRGARRRMAVNYGAKGVEQYALAGDVGAESSDSSDDFDVTNAPEDSDEDIDPSTKASHLWVYHQGHQRLACLRKRDIALKPDHKQLNSQLPLL